MKKVIFGVIGVILVFGVIGALSGGDKGSSQDRQESAKIEEQKNMLIPIGTPAVGDYFEVTVNSVSTIESKVINSLIQLKKEEGNKYLIMNTTFKNISKESRMISEGSLFINYNGQKYEFDKAETILADGWGIIFEQINPLTTFTTNIVYKIPSEIEGEVIYKPGREDIEISLGTIK